jgi:sugar lactone lactonase YvrE
VRVLFALLFATRLFAQEFGHLEVQRIVANLHFAEGPVWSYDGFLVFSDTVVDKLFKVIPGGADQVFAERAGGAIGNAYDTEGRLYSCEFRQRRVTRTLKNGKVEVLAARFEGKRFNAPNDVVVRRDGQVYFTDPAFGAQQDTRELDFYGVYQITSKRELKLVAKPAGRPNGIALSPNGKVLYVANSDERNVRAYDLDGKGEASGERIFIAKTDGIPDGLRTDEKGNLYVAADALMVYSPAGKLLATIPVPEKPSGCAFGDADGKSLYMTARGTVYRVRLE